MAVSIKELIEKKEELANKKKRKYDIETSAGKMTVKLPTRSYVAEVMKLEGSDELLFLDCIIEPSLKDAGLQEAYGCLELTDIIGKLFDAGEIPGLGRKVMELAGYGPTFVRRCMKTQKTDRGGLGGAYCRLPCPQRA